MTPLQIVSVAVAGLMYTWACMLFGAWMFYRGRSGASPLPSLPHKVETVENTDAKPFELPRVRP